LRERHDIGGLGRRGKQTGAEQHRRAERRATDLLDEFYVAPPVLCHSGNFGLQTQFDLDFIGIA
jgi:hypothetical protein